jgi:hypothetical protein
MKNIIFIIVLVFARMSLFGVLEYFPENPANIADRDYSHVKIPGLTHELNIANTLLKFDDINMFQEGHHLSENEKKTLTSGDLNVLGNFKVTLLDFGSKNWNVSQEVIGSVYMSLLDKTYSTLVFYGNEVDKIYSTEVGKNSKAFNYWKTSFTYAYPKELNLGMIPGFPEAEKGILKTLREMPIYAGARLNFNYSGQFGGILESSQDFGSMEDSLHYDIYARYAHSDSKSSGNLNPSLGFGFKAKILDGFFYFSVDDLFLQLRFNNLAGQIYESTVTDSLLYLQPGATPEVFEDIQNDSLRVKKYTVKVSPAISIGAKYDILDNLNVMMKYSHNEFNPTDGFAVGATYVLKFMPVQAVLGFSETAYFKFQTGFKFRNFEWIGGLTFHHGMFRYAKGIGLLSSIDFRF